VTHHLAPGPGARGHQRPRVELPRNPVVKAVLVGAVGFSGLFSLAMCVGMMAFLGWVFFRMFEDNLAAGLAVTLVMALVIGVPSYFAARLGLRMGRQLRDFPQEYRRRVKAKSELPIQPGPPGGSDLGLRRTD
jgi:hypothetical protein